ncbi:MAG: hypothetical protein J0I77_18505 [Rudaea sp.]|nr:MULTISPECIES: hypothetical protein [unclassified Rudaea]MBN8887724.1 hypothetical protein [Rudaea sp.]
MTSANVVVVAVVLVLAVGPIVLGLFGAFGPKRVAAAASGDAHAAWNWRLTALSTLLYVLAFNLTFFLQELFLVLPKAFTPGIRAALFHNNHSWQGDHPLARLFQGTGAVATVLAALACAWLLRRSSVQSTTARLFLIWMAYCGFFMALPQVAVGALSNGSDLGMAMGYFGLGAAVKAVFALVALALIPPIALWLDRQMLELADDPARIATRGARTRFVLQTAVLPAFLAILPIIAFRVPREWIEVVMPPLVVAWIGTVWMLAGAWRIDDAKAGGRAGEISLARPLIAVLLLLLIFQCVLRPGIRFY